MAMPMEKAPQKSLSAAGVTYTCPMHPEIRQRGPGNCPICGMTLEPLVVTTEDSPNVELRDMSRRFWVGLALTIPVLFLEMGSHIPGLGLHDLVSPRTSSWVQFILSTPVVLWAGWPFFQRPESASRGMGVPRALSWIRWPSD